MFLSNPLKTTVLDAIKFSSKNVIYQILKADLLIDMGLLDFAESILLDFKGEFKQNIIIQKDILLSKLYKVQRKFAKSETVLLKLKSLYPETQIVYLNLSDLYYEDHNLKKGIETLLLGIKLFPIFLQMNFIIDLFFKKRCFHLFRYFKMCLF